MLVSQLNYDKLVYINYSLTNYVIINKCVGVSGIGHSSGKRLRELGIVSVADLQMADSSVLEEEFGLAAAETMKKLCVGNDDSRVVAFGLPQVLKLLSVLLTPFKSVLQRISLK